MAVVSFKAAGEEIFYDKDAEVYNPTLTEFIITGAASGDLKFLEVATKEEVEATVKSLDNKGGVELSIRGYFTNINIKIKIGEPVSFIYEYKGVKTLNGG